MYSRRSQAKPWKLIVPDAEINEKVKPYWILEAKRKEINTEMKRMLELGIAERPIVNGLA